MEVVFVISIVVPLGLLIAVIGPITSKLPLIIALPVYGNGSLEMPVRLEPSPVNEPVNEPVMVALLPLTIIASLLNEPIFTVSSENTSKMGNPEISDTANKDPDKESVIENNCPWDPTTSNIVDPELSRVNLEAVMLFKAALLPDIMTFFQQDAFILNHFHIY